MSEDLNVNGVEKDENETKEEILDSKINNNVNLEINNENDENDKNDKNINVEDSNSNKAKNRINEEITTPINVNNIDPELRKWTKLFVGGLPFTSDDSALHTYFSQFGSIIEAVVIRDRRTGSSKGYGFVTMADRESAAKALFQLYPIIDGRRCNVNYAFVGAKPNYSSLDDQLYYDRYPDGVIDRLNYDPYSYFNYTSSFWNTIPYSSPFYGNIPRHLKKSNLTYPTYSLDPLFISNVNNPLYTLANGTILPPYRNTYTMPFDFSLAQGYAGQWPYGTYPITPNQSYFYTSGYFPTEENTNDKSNLNSASTATNTNINTNINTNTNTNTNDYTMNNLNKTVESLSLNEVLRSRTTTTTTTTTTTIATELPDNDNKSEENKSTEKKNFEPNNLPDASEINNNSSTNVNIHNL